MKRKKFKPARKTKKLTEKQKEWLEEFIEVWDKGNDVESWLYENEVKDAR